MVSVTGEWEGRTRSYNVDNVIDVLESHNLSY